MVKYAGAAEALVGVGYARVQITGHQRGTLARVRAEAARFFGRSDAEKRAYGSEDFNFGFRPYGRQYSIAPDRPDMNESFTFWGEDPVTIPRHHEIGTFADALRAYRATAAELAEAILGQLAAHFSCPSVLSFGSASYLEINWYLQAGDRSLLQDRHEDGHLLTLVTSDGPGLEIDVGGQMQPVSFQRGDLLAMPGSLLTDMTGGAVPPLFHQVRNHHLRRRMSVLYLVNPQLDNPVEPYVVTDYNRGVDIARRARTNGAMFGLPKAPVLP
jgi:isopenicillin N synthase-like dioxygenase